METFDKYKNAPELDEMEYLMDYADVIKGEPKYALAKASFSPIPDTLAKAKGCYGKLGYCSLEMLLNWFKSQGNITIHQCGEHDMMNSVGYRVRVTGLLLTGTSSSLWFCPECGAIETEKGTNFKELRNIFFAACELSRKEFPEGCEVMDVGEVITELKQKILANDMGIKHFTLS